MNWLLRNTLISIDEERYQVEVLPTYIVIDSEGNVAFCDRSEKGFSDLRNALKKAGLDTD
jgi:hypothetical protein